MKKIIRKIINWAYNTNIQDKIKRSEDKYFEFDRRIQDVYCAFSRYMTYNPDYYVSQNKEILNYADTYSHKVWEELMRRYKENSNYYIGANDVSDIVLNAILNAFNGMKFPEDFTKI